MRRPLRLLLCCATVLLSGQVSAQTGGRSGQPAAAQRDVTLQNRAQRTITEFYASPTNTDDWGDDRLGNDTLLPGKQFRARLGVSRECQWDLKVTYEDQSTEENRDLNLCRTRTVTFDGSNAVAAAPVGTERTVTIQNSSVRQIDQVFISSPDSDGWDDDRLSGQIAAGANSPVTFRGECLADVRIVYESRAAEERRGLDLCKFSRLVITPGWTLSDDPSAEPEPPRGEQSVVVNRSGRVITELYVFPDGTPRNEDRLGMTTLENEQRKQIELGRGQPCRYTVRVVFSGTGTPPELESSGFNLCRTGQLDVTGTEVKDAASQ